MEIDDINPADLLEAAARFTDSWRELMTGMLMHEYGCPLQCDEAEAAADLYRVMGDPSAAEAILDEHALTDTAEELHYERGVEALNWIRTEVDAQVHQETEKRWAVESSVQRNRNTSKGSPSTP